MAFGGFGGGRNSTPMADINVIPLVDIMLVLLVIFIVTAPLLTHSVKVDLPKAESAPNATQAANVQFALDGSGQMYWDGEPIDRAQMVERMTAAGARDSAPELHLRIDRQARYETIADVMSEAAKAGLTKIGFVTDPSQPIAPVAAATP
ncbi:MAG: ExbD/TolR family protein [Phenylobacterium sp.]|uniref:ExbD/TolR family protein n=1 Tax=Phenylobacterium sp. TaxID=1871053 RepID=UPI00391BBD15